MTTPAVLDVFLHGRHVGELRREGQAIVFDLDESYGESYPRPILGQWFEEHRRTRVSFSERLPAWFGNLLPEGVLRDLIAREIGASRWQEIRLLAHVGADLPGAVTVRPQEGGDLAEEVVPDLTPVGEALRFSLAGIQLKFSVARAADRLTLPAKGKGGHWIVKLPDLGHEAVPENEWTVMTWAREAGVGTPPFELVESTTLDGVPGPVLEAHRGAAFLVSRFDRGPEDDRVHTEDFAQVLWRYPEEKYEGANYETIANIVFRLVGRGGLEEFVRRLVAIVLSGNSDAHLKNWSLVYPDGRHAELSPAYDLVSTVVYDPYRSDGLALRLNGTKDFAAVTPATFLQLGEKIGYDSPERLAWLARDTAVRMRDLWRDNAADWPMPGHLKERLDEHLKRVRLGA